MPIDKVLIVVGIIEGRRFPRRPKYKILVEAKFDGEVLSTDPVDHIENPEFTTELAWESDKKTLHQHRLQRTPIKLQCYAVDMIDKRKEPIGYCILDLRSVQMQEFQQQKPQWHALLSSKYQKMKPEIKLILSFEDESKRISSPPNQTKEKLHEDDTKETASNLHPVLDEKEGYYVIGDKSNATNVFCMSITIATARNLAKLIPSTTELRQQDGFYFFYSLMENDVISEPFYDVIQPEFAAERASIRIFTNNKTLKKFIDENPSIKVHFCSGENRLASTSISLKPLLMDDLSSGDPAKIEGLFPLNAPQTTPLTKSLKQVDALVGISIILRMEKDDIGSLSAMTSVLAAGGNIVVPEHPFSPATKQQQKSADEEQHKREEKSPRLRESEKRSKTDIEKESETTVTHDPGYSPAQKENEKYRSIQNEKKTMQKSNHLQKPIQQKAKSHHYCYSIDLRSLKNLDINNPMRFYCRYSYPFFGNSSPILTSPAVEIHRNTEVLLPKSFCAFDFATSSQLLEQTLARIPLIIEIWQKDSNRKDIIFGICQVFLSSVFAAEKILVQNGNYRQIHSQPINVISPNSSKKRIGSLFIVLGLEDFGEVSEQPVTSSALTTTQSLCSTSTVENTTSDEPHINIHQKTTQQPSSKQQQQQQVEVHHGSNLSRDLPEYKAAIELEIWKEQQEETFNNMLKQKESKLMQTLAEEWKKRDKEREMILKRKVDEYNNLEEKLRTSIDDIERREKQVTSNEVEITRLQADLLREHEQKLSFLRDASIRMKEDCEHRVELERLKLQEITEQNQRYKEQLQVYEKRYKDKENEILIFKEQQMNQPENKLQAELKLALLEKVELERKLDSITKSKIHYKQQWGKALRELAKMKQNEQMAAKARLKKQERELEHMRLRYLAAEEKEVVKSEKDELETIKAQLQRLQDAQVTTPATKQQSQQSNKQINNPALPRGNPDDSSGKDELQDQLLNNRIAKLIEERDTLLRTGVYSTDDKIIYELDRQIREAIASKDR